MQRPLTVASVLLGLACAHSPEVVPPRDEYVTRMPRECPVADLSLEILNLGPYPLEVFWVVGRRSNEGSSGRYRVGRGAPGRTVVKLSENVSRMIQSNVDGHWDVPPVKNYGKGYSLTLQCGTTVPRALLGPDAVR